MAHSHQTTGPSVPIFSTSDISHVEATCQTYGLSRHEFAELHRQAAEAKAAAHCPYSNFRVGAALLTRYGRAVVTGANIENASYPVGTCAERVAMARAVMDGHRAFVALAVATDTVSPCSPCGMCRQFIREFCDVDLPVIMFDKKGDFSVLRLETLLPLSFGPDSLKLGTGPPEPGVPEV